MIDDNVLNWVGITLVDDTECLFGGTIPTGRKATCRKLNRPMWEALSYLQDREFADLERFALLGFQRLGNPKYHNHLTAPFVRSHVYKCYLLNLNRLEERDYDGAVWAVEDVDFNKQLVCDCFPPMGRGAGQLCFAASRAPPERCDSWGSDASRTSEVLCKIRRFGFYGKKLKNGASGTSQDEPRKTLKVTAPDAAPEAAMDEPKPPAPASAGEDVDVGWLQQLVWGKLTDAQVAQVIANVKASGLEFDDFLGMFPIDAAQFDIYLQDIIRIESLPARNRIYRALKGMHESS